MLRFIWWRLLAVRVDIFIFAFFLLRCLLLLCFFIFIFLPFIWFQIWKNPKYYWSISRNFAQKKNCSNLKNRSWFLEPYGPTTVRTGPYFFSQRMVFEIKKTTKLRGSWFSRSDRTVWYGFQNLARNLTKNCNLISIGLYLKFKTVFR